QAEDGIRDFHVTGVQTCALPIFAAPTLPSGLAGRGARGCALDYWTVTTGRAGSVVHSAMEPSYMLVFLLPSTSERPNHATEAQWPVLQKAMFASSASSPTAAASEARVSELAKAAAEAS